MSTKPKIFPFLGNYMCPGSDAPADSVDTRWMPRMGIGAGLLAMCPHCERIIAVRDGELTVHAHRVNRTAADIAVIWFMEDGIRVT